MVLLHYNYQQSKSCFSNDPKQKDSEDFFRAKGIKIINSNLSHPEITHIIGSRPLCNRITFGALVSGKKFLEIRYASQCLRENEVLMNFSEYEYFRNKHTGIYACYDHWPKRRLSEELKEIVGTNIAYQDDVAKLMCTHIKENDLQDPKNEEYIICDEKLEEIVGKKKIRYSEIFRPVPQHMLS